MTLLLARLFLLLAFVPALAAAQLPAGVRAGPTVEGVTEFSLDNGLACCCSRTHRKPTITVNITYLVGSRHENYGETGMAHLLEHMLFMGTPSIPNVWQEFGSRGAEFNGTTLVRPHQLLRDLSRHRREPRVGAETRSGPHDAVVRREEGSWTPK